MVFVDHDKSSIFIEIGCELGKDLVEGNAHRYFQAVFFEDFVLDLFCEMDPVCEQGLAGAQIEPRFIEPERFHTVSIFAVDVFDFFGVIRIGVIIGMDDEKSGTFGVRFAQGFAGLDAAGSGQIVFCQDDPVSLFLAAADCHRNEAQRRVLHFFNLRIAVI